MPLSESSLAYDLPLLRQNTEQACEHLLEQLPPPAVLSPNWQAQRAPGSQITSADDARRIWTMLAGWTKLTVPFALSEMPIQPGEAYTNSQKGWKTYHAPRVEGQPVITQDLSLPDAWPADRDYYSAWYLLQTTLDPSQADAFWLRFDAVAHACTVFINGVKAGHHLGGYTPCEFDLTQFIQPGANTIVLRVQDETAAIHPITKRKLSMMDIARGNHHAHAAGIRGGVYLEARQAAHIARTRIRTSTRHQRLTVESWLRTWPADGEVSHEVYAWPDGSEPVLTLTKEIKQGEHHIEAGIDWPDPKLWSPSHPNLYVLRTTVRTEGGSESIETRFGFREFWIEGECFMLNGKPIRLIGDAAYRKELLSIVPDKARLYNREALSFLKRHFNFMSIRLHGSIYPTWATQAADEAGYLVIDQTGFKSTSHVDFSQHGQTLLQNSEPQYTAWYWRDVNCPSVVIWDVECELLRSQKKPALKQTVLQLNRLIAQHDPGAIIEHSGAAWNDPAVRSSMCICRSSTTASCARSRRRRRCRWWWANSGRVAAAKRAWSTPGNIAAARIGIVRKRACIARKSWRCAISASGASWRIASHSGL